jgi:hypothetical protein
MSQKKVYDIEKKEKIIRFYGTCQYIEGLNPRQMALFFNSHFRDYPQNNPSLS